MHPTSHSSSLRLRPSVSCGRKTGAAGAVHLARPSVTLAHELSSLDAARGLLARGDATGALARLDAYGRAYPHGRYEHVRSDFIARRMDFRTRRVELYDNSSWVVATYDVDRCRDWQWDRDRVYVYDDDHHPGWYLLFNARLGRYVHVEYFGVH